MTYTSNNARYLITPEIYVIKITTYFCEYGYKSQTTPSGVSPHSSSIFFFWIVYVMSIPCPCRKLKMIVWSVSSSSILLKRSAMSSVSSAFCSFRLSMTFDMKCIPLVNASAICSGLDSPDASALIALSISAITGLDVIVLFGRAVLQGDPS